MLKRISFILSGIVILILFSIPIFYKFQWNRNAVAIGSDPQIKYYQTFSLYQNLSIQNNLQCYFPAGEIGFSIKTIPIGYPWAFVTKEDTCFFQYPLIMPFIHALIAKLTHFSLVLYLPIFSFFINFLIVVGIFRILGANDLVSIYLSLSLQFLTPVFISSVDYSEVTLSNSFFLSAIYLYERLKVSEWKKSMVFIVLCAFSIALTFQLRPESTIAIIILFLIGFLMHIRSFERMRIYFAIGFVFLFITCLFSYFNYSNYHHVLGMRGWNTLQDTQVLTGKQYLLNWIADLWGSDFKIGVFKAYPVLAFFMILPIFFKIQKKKIQFLLAGMIFLFVLPILSPYRAGVDILGLRYYESGVYLLAIGGLSTIFIETDVISSRRKISIIVIILVSLSYFGYKSNTRAIKQWSGAAKVSNTFTKKILELKPDLIIHRGLATTYLMGVTYLEIPQIVMYSQSDWSQLETILLKNGMKRILYLYWEGNQLVDTEFPRSIWNQFFDINFNFEVGRNWNQESIEIIHFKGLLLKSK
ncbi:hypothetical protein AB3N58_09295 [Leptospira sp. WS60.C2]